MKSKINLFINTQFMNNPIKLINIESCDPNLYKNTAELGCRKLRCKESLVLTSKKK